MNRYWLSLGSNLGDRLEHLTAGLAQLSQLTQLDDISSIYETDPVGPVEQQDFLNLCCTLETDLEPEALLTLCQSIEASRERQRSVHWGPRTLDIDLLFGPAPHQTNTLTLPHPEALKRDFVMVPLLDLRILPPGVSQSTQASATVRRFSAPPELDS